MQNNSGNMDIYTSYLDKKYTKRPENIQEASGFGKLAVAIDAMNKIDWGKTGPGELQGAYRQSTNGNIPIVACRFIDIQSDATDGVQARYWIIIKEKDHMELREFFFIVGPGMDTSAIVSKPMPIKSGSKETAFTGSLDAFIKMARFKDNWIK